MDGLCNIAEFLFVTNPHIPQFYYLPWEKLPSNQVVTQCVARGSGMGELHHSA